MDESQFTLETLKVINSIIDIIEKEDKNELIDVDYHNDVLTIQDDRGIFVINKQTPKREIWLSSPVSGPHHFQYSKNNNNIIWVNNSGTALFDLLQKELNIKFK